MQLNNSTQNTHCQYQLHHINKNDGVELLMMLLNNSLTRLSIII